MITANYTRTAPLSVTIASSAREITSLLLTRQSTIADLDYNHRSTLTLAEVLSPSLVDVYQSGDIVGITINYPLTIRFLDLKRTSTGKKKKYYTAIYNRPLFGHLYGRGYSLSNLVNSAIKREHSVWQNQLKDSFSTIEL